MFETSLHRALLRVGAATVAGGLLVAGVAAPASAHVTVSSSTDEAGSYAVLTFSVPHGCSGSPTTEVVISLPEAIPQVTPTRHALWEVATVTEEFDEPLTDGHGNEITERVAQVVYSTDQPLPDDQRDVFQLSVRLPDAAGETLVFPVVQTCPDGEEAWTETPAEGQDAHDLDYPAPALTLTAGSGHGHGHDEGATEDATDEVTATDGEATSNRLALVGLGVGGLGVLLGGLALTRGRKA